MRIINGDELPAMTRGEIAQLVNALISATYVEVAKATGQPLQSTENALADHAIAIAHGIIANKPVRPVFDDDIPKPWSEHVEIATEGKRICAELVAQFGGGVR